MPRTRRSARRIRVNGAFGRVLAFGPLNIPVVFVDPDADNVLRAGRVIIDPDGSVHSVSSPSVRDDGSPAGASDVIGRRVVTARGNVVISDAALWAAIGQPNGVTPLTTFVDAATLTDGTYSVMRSLTLTPGTLVGTSLRPSEAASYGLGVLYAALARENAIALTQIIFDGSPRFIAIQPDGGVALLRYANEVTEFPPTLVADVVSAADMILYARMLVAGRKNNDAPRLHDTTGSQIAAFAATIEPDAVALPVAPEVVIPASRQAVEESLRTMPALLGVAGVGVPAADPFSDRPRRRPFLRNISDDDAYEVRRVTVAVDPF